MKKISKILGISIVTLFIIGAGYAINLIPQNAFKLILFIIAILYIMKVIIDIIIKKNNKQ